MFRDAPQIYSTHRLERTAFNSGSSFVSGSSGFVDQFGTNPSFVGHYPSDVIQVDVFNAVDRYLESTYRFTSFSLHNNTVTVDIEQAIADLGYVSGKYKAQFRFLRNHLGSGDGVRLKIQEISSNGLEVRVVPVANSDQDNASFHSFFAEGFFAQRKANVLPNLQLFRDARTSVGVFDYVQDRFTFTDFPYSIILKLTTPSAELLRVGDSVWLAQEVSSGFEDTILVTPPALEKGLIEIGAPNWEVVISDRTNLTTDYKDWDDLLSTNNATTQALVNQLFSGSLLEGISLNYDFTRFEDFVHFGSAEERLRNFRYKMELLEYYDQRIELLNPTPSIPEASSSYSLSNVVEATTKRNNILGSFDAYEEHLYYQSSSYQSSSFGEFFPTTWPKSNGTAPYINYPTTSSEATSWFSGWIQSASAFDALNPHSLSKTVPLHVQQDQVNQQYLLLVNLIGHYFDVIYAYVKGLGDIHDRNESLFEGFSKDLVYHVAQSLGVDFENGNTLDDLWSYLLGTDQEGNLASSYEGATADKTKETWKRIVNNLPYLLKTKGTERGLRALISCFGIPQTILRIREFGGPEPDFDSRTDWSYERFGYATTVGYNGATGGDVNQKISVPWVAMAENGGAFPETVQLRVRMAPSQSKDQTIFKLASDNLIVEAVNGDAVQLTANGSSAAVSCSIYDGTFHLLTLTRSGSTTSLIVKKTNYGKVVSTVSASVNSTSTAASTLYIPSDDVVAANDSHSAAIFSGSVQELRFWNVVLNDGIIDNHALAPTSFQGNDQDSYSGTTSSYDDLAFRLTLGSDAKKVNYLATASISSSHPNQTLNYFTSGSPKKGAFANFAVSSSVPIVETHFLEWPDLGANRTVSNKIRIDSTFVAGNNQLYRNSSVVRSLGDNNPPDSSRLGVYLSPTNEVDQDIAEQFGGLSIDDFIGDPAYRELVNYPGLEHLKYQYTKKYSRRNNAQAYIRLLASFDASLFQLIKKLVPYRANTQVGLVIEPTILDRSKLPAYNPSIYQLHWSSSLSSSIRPGGFVQDGDGEPFRNMRGYVQAGLINLNEDAYLVPGGLIQDGDNDPRRETNGYVQAGVVELDPVMPTVNYDYVIFDRTIYPSPDLNGTTDQYGRYLDDGVGNKTIQHFGTAFDEINLRQSQYGRDLAAHGSQYTFMTYATSGSGSTRSEPYLITSSQADYGNSLSTIVIESTRSEISNVGDHPYDSDIFNGKGFDFLFTTASSYDLNQIGPYMENPWTGYYGLRPQSASVTSSGQWSMIGGNYDYPQGLTLTMRTNGTAVTNRALLDAFFYEESKPFTKDLWYQVDVVMNLNTVVGGFGYGRLEFGSVGSPYYANLGTLPKGTGREFVLDSIKSFITKATGPHLVLSSSLASSTINGNYVYTPIVRVRCLNYRAPVQDFHLHNSYGMCNARYDGCKLTSADWNVDSQDTIDGGPVVTIIQTNGTDLVTHPTARGTFEVRGTSGDIPTTTRTGTRTNTRRQ